MRYGVIALLLVLVFVAGIHTLTSITQDIGRHLTLGKIIWETHAVPRINLFSYTAPDSPFINHHWLGEVFLYLGSVVFGLKGLIVAKACILTLAFAMAFFASYRKEQGLEAVALGLLALSILIERTDVRPEMFSFLFFGWYLFILFRKPYGGWLWSLPIVALIWVNTHIYFFLAPTTVALFVIGQIAREGWQGLRRYLSLVAAVGVAVLMNPWGWQGATYPLRVFGNYGYSVVENQTPFFLRSFGYSQFTTHAVYLGIALVAILLMVNAKRWRENIFLIGLAMVSGWLALDMIRNFPIFALALMPIAMRLIQQAKMPEIKISWTVPVFLVALIYAVMSNQLYAQAGMSQRFGLEVPAGAQRAVDFFRDHHLKGPIFNNFDIGSFLIWKLPEEKVFIDGRPEAYPADFIQKVYIPMQDNEQVWNKYSKEYNIQTIFWNSYDITPWSQTFLERISRDKAWKQVYHEYGTVIFVR
jgi:hypothetical protein